MEKTNLIKMAEELLKKCHVCSVASVSESGFPRICMLAQLKSDGIKSLWFSTGASGTKVRHFKSNQKAGVTFYDGGDSVTLTGAMEIITDKKIKGEFWEKCAGFLANHFSGADDPEYVIIKFVASVATIYVNGEFDNVQL